MQGSVRAVVSPRCSLAALLVNTLREPCAYTILGIVITSALQTWCNLHAFGADCCRCGGPRGFCGDRCASCFDHDDFDERLREDQVRKQKAENEAVTAQPPPAKEMSVPEPSEISAKPS
ncbi:hypothetical protein ID866_8014 [Astraeus odoratus]|nr:hypothetical protein ID866_8014 [Astraeus odoratus]